MASLWRLQNSVPIKIIIIIIIIGDINLRGLIKDCWPTARKLQDAREDESRQSQADSWLNKGRKALHRKMTGDDKILRQEKAGLAFSAMVGIEYAEALCNDAGADDRRSVSGWAVMMIGAMISWASKRQPVTAISSTESEFYSVSQCAVECVYLRRVLELLGFFHVLHLTRRGLTARDPRTLSTMK